MNTDSQTYNAKDRDAWNNIFQSAPPEWTRAWKEASPTEDMKDGLAFFRKNGATAILDVGCGVGVWSLYLSKNGLDVYATDFSSSAVEFAKAWSDEQSLDIDFEVAPLTEPPFGEMQFDGVLASKVLENVSHGEMRLGISRLRERLKPGGSLVAIFNPHLDAEQLSAIKASANPTKDITHTVYTDNELKDAFAGFELVQFKTYPQGYRGLFLIRS